MSADRETVLRVLEGQSPDYFIFPNAAAFAAEGLDLDEVAVVLADMHDAGELEREMLAVAGTGADDGGTVLVPGGYRIAEAPEKPAKKGGKK